ncbi:MAG: TraK domain-containing protein [Gammaproteobacteria bacterium]
MRRILLVILNLLIASQVYATQIRGVIDNETITAKISSLDITRIIVQGDRIKTLKGIKGAYTRENDENNGEVYLQPSTLYQNAAFTVLIETEKKRHFTLLLTPVAVPGGTLMLVPKGVGREEAAQFEQSSDYQTTISHLIRAMATDSVPEGYSISEVDNKTLYHFGNIATLRLKTIYQGLHFQGQIYELTNTQSFPIKLDEKQFFKQGISAISLENVTVAPHGKIKLIRVVSHA